MFLIERSIHARPSGLTARAEAGTSWAEHLGWDPVWQNARRVKRRSGLQERERA